ncbi:hypothetical protein Sango_2802100 [Sesamum angolense]|uniref:Tf2-1-like SH3-like domain-containing protein n=1 Tax=Sesamum angolense TaxID=2727404 RepID=A0AAE1T7Y4_9LAMI|nr:hypothetical protein Sango_2802100 [Sesamum angolense]
MRYEKSMKRIERAMMLNEIDEPAFKEIHVCNERNRKKVEFLELEQNELSVAGNELQFVRLSKYTPEEVSTDELKRDRFERGLRLKIREKIAIKPPSYGALLEAALRAEETSLERSFTKAKRKKLTGNLNPIPGQCGAASFRGSGLQSDALSRKTVDHLASMICYNVKYLIALKAMDVHFSIGGNILLATMQVKTSLKDKIRDAQEKDPHLQKMKTKVQEGKKFQFIIQDDERCSGVRGKMFNLSASKSITPSTDRKHDAIWVVVDRLTKSAHFLPIRQDDSLDKLAELYVSRKFTAFHPLTDRQSERKIQMLEDMMRACIIEFRGNWDDHLPLMEFAYNNSFHSSIRMAPYEALYGSKSRSPICWDIEGLRQLEGPELVQKTVDKIQAVKKCLKAAQDRQKSYTDTHRREMEYEVGEKVILKVSPWRGILRFGKQRKLSPRYIGPYEILERVGPLAYRLALPAELSQIHDVFHISMLRRYRSDPSHILREPEIEVSEGLTYVEEPIEILDRTIKKLRNKEISMVKVKWSHHSPRETTWEVEENMREKYPYLFLELVHYLNFGDEIFY